LSPIRLTVDDDVRRPYWIERDSSIQCQWDERIVVEGDVTSAKILLGNYVYDIQDSTATRATITDSVASAFLGRMSK